MYFFFFSGLGQKTHMVLIVFAAFGGVLVMVLQSWSFLPAIMKFSSSDISFEGDEGVEEQRVIFIYVCFLFFESGKYH